MTQEPITLEQLNALDQQAFIERVGFAFEHSPWVAEQAYSDRPFGSLEALVQTLTDVVASAPAEDQVALIRAHPELAVADPESLNLTSASEHEQRSIGLRRLSHDLAERLSTGTARYRAKHGFPFVIAVRGRDVNGIVAELDRRTQNTTPHEVTAALGEITSIARFRLSDTIVDGGRA